MKIISFNSYKGGACRTTTCYNALPYIAKALKATSDEPIIVYDIDLDSMGLTNIFHVGVDSDTSKMKYSAKYLFVDDDNDINSSVYRDGLLSVKDDDEYFGYYEKVGKKLGLDDDGSVLFLGADKNASTISDDSYLKFAKAPPIQKLISNMQQMRPAPKAIIFDCASGVQMTTLAALRMADCCVMCMRPTFQFRIGTGDYLLNAIPDEIANRKTGQKREIVLLPTAVAQVEISESDPNREQALAMLNGLRSGAFKDIRRGIINEYIRESKSRDLGYVLNTEMVETREDDAVVGIPEIERFKWEEGLLYVQEDMTEQEKVLKKQYEKLAGIVTR